MRRNRIPGLQVPVFAYLTRDTVRDLEFEQAGEHIRTLGPGMLFGEGAALRPGATRAATATAAPGTELLRIPGERVRAAINEEIEGKP